MENTLRVKRTSWLYQWPLGTIRPLALKGVVKRLPLELLKQLSQARPCSSFYSVSVKTECKYNDTCRCFQPEKQKGECGLGYTLGVCFEHVLWDRDVGGECFRVCRISGFPGVFSGGRTCPLTRIPDSSLLERPVKLQSILCQKYYVLLRVQRFLRERKPFNTLGLGFWVGGLGFNLGLEPSLGLLRGFRPKCNQWLLMHSGL